MRSTKTYLKQQNLINKTLLKIKTKGIKRSSGRNNLGRITVFHKGGGHKRTYRFINFFKNTNSRSIVCSIEYDPNRNAFIAAVYDFINKNFYYTLAPKNLNIGDIMESGTNAPLKLGNSLPLERVPLGSYLHNVSVCAKGYAKVARSAGTFVLIKEKKSTGVIIELNSGQRKLIPSTCFGSLGIVSNESVRFKKKYKAGQSRWLNTRPTVRGVAMNPIDHPHGGGEGKKIRLK